MGREKLRKEKWVKLFSAAAVASSMMASSTVAFASTSSTSSLTQAKDDALTKLSQELSLIQQKLVASHQDSTVNKVVADMNSASSATWQNIVFNTPGSTKIDAALFASIVEQLLMMATYGHGMNTNGNFTTQSSDIQNLKDELVTIAHDTSTSTQSEPVVTGTDLYNVFESVKHSMESSLASLISGSSTSVSATNIVTGALQSAVSMNSDLAALFNYYGVNISDVETRALSQFDSNHEGVDAMAEAFAMTVLTAVSSTASLAPAAQSLNVGDTAHFYLVIDSPIASIPLPNNFPLPSSGPYAVTWTSSDTNVVTTSTDPSTAFQVTAVGKGPATLTAWFEGHAVYSISIVVSSKPGSVPSNDHGSPGSPTYNLAQHADVVFQQTITPSQSIQTSTTTSGGNVTLNVPSNSFNTNVTVTMAMATPDELKAADDAIASTPGSGVLSGYTTNSVLAVFFNDASTGTSVNPTQTVTLSVYDPTIPAGAVVYKVTDSGLKPVPASVNNGVLTISFSTDPYFVIATPNPGVSTPPTTPPPSSTPPTGTGDNPPPTPKTITNIPLSKFPGATGNGNNSPVTRMNQSSDMLTEQNVDAKGGTFTTQVGGSTVTLNVPAGAFKSQALVGLTSDADPMLVNLELGSLLNGASPLHVFGVFFADATTGKAVTPSAPVTLTISDANVPSKATVSQVTDAGLVSVNAQVSVGQVGITTGAASYFLISVPASQSTSIPPSNGGHHGGTPQGAVPTYLNLTANGKSTTKAPRAVIKGQVYVPIWYVMYELKKLGFTSKWDGKHNALSLTSPKSLKAQYAKMVFAKANVSIYLNGHLVAKSPSKVQADPFTNQTATWMPMGPLEAVLNHVQVKSEVSGNTWNFVTPTVKKKK